MAEAKARLGELTELAAMGEEVVITERGNPLATLPRLDAPRRPFERQALRELTGRMPPQPESSDALMCRMGEDSRA